MAQYLSGFKCVWKFFLDPDYYTGTLNRRNNCVVAQNSQQWQGADLSSWVDPVFQGRQLKGGSAPSGLEEPQCWIWNKQLIENEGGISERRKLESHARLLGCWVDILAISLTEPRASHKHRNSKQPRRGWKSKKTDLWYSHSQRDSW